MNGTDLTPSQVLDAIANNAVLQALEPEVAVGVYGVTIVIDPASPEEQRVAFEQTLDALFGSESVGHLRHVGCCVDSERFWISSNAPDDADDILVRVKFQVNEHTGQHVEDLHDYWPGNDDLILGLDSADAREFGWLMTEIIDWCCDTYLSAWRQGERPGVGERTIRLWAWGAEDDMGRRVRAKDEISEVDLFLRFDISASITKATARKLQELCTWFPDELLITSSEAEGQLVDPSNSLFRFMIDAYHQQHFEAWKQQQIENHKAAFLASSGCLFESKEAAEAAAEADARLVYDAAEDWPDKFELHEFDFLELCGIDDELESLSDELDDE